MVYNKLHINIIINNTMKWSLSIADTFFSDLGRVNKKAKNKWSDVQNRLKDSPTDPSGSAIKKLTHWKNLWRYRIGDYRLIYRADKKTHTVTCLILDKRDRAYSRLGHTNDGPSLEIIANEDLANLLEEEPTDNERGKAFYKLQESINKPNDTLLSSPIPTEEDLNNLSIPGNFHTMILKCRTEEDLLNLEHKGVDSPSIEKMMEYFFPSSIESIVNDAIRISEKDDDFDQILNKDKKLEDFLLQLDDTQKPFVNRFSGKAPIGPWLVKGGPGSGKSTVAIYCIKELLNTLSRGLIQDDNIRILFTTYTHSLVNASTSLLRHLGVDNTNSSIDIVNIDKLAGLHSKGNCRNFANFNNKWKAHLIEAINSADPLNKFFDENDIEFLREEVEFCIIGEGLNSEDQYINYDRSGRDRRLGAKQRPVLWKIYTNFELILARHKQCLLSHRFLDASINASAIYDYVFIDEAQDLSPTQIRLCTKLAKKGNVFLTADVNQSIYGSSFSWKKASDGLDFRGKATNLKKNYRTTVEIWKATLPILSKIKGSDKETLDYPPFRHGDMPSLLLTQLNDRFRKTNEWITNSALKEKLPYSCVAVLCPTKRICQSVESSMPIEFNAKAMDSKSIDLAHNGVKIITQHASKGLQFPVVVVMGIDKNTIPREATGGRSQAEIDDSARRLFFVACTRAINKLLVVSDINNQSKLLEELPVDEWNEIE